MAYGLVLGNDYQVASWAFATYKLFPTPVNMGLGIIDQNGVMVGAILLQNFNGTNIELSYYGPRTLSVGIVRSIARLVVTEFNAARLTVVTSKRNKRLMKSLQRIGFRLEGAQRYYYGHKDCTRNTGVRFVAFRPDIERVAGLPSTKEQDDAVHTTPRL